MLHAAGFVFGGLQGQLSIAPCHKVPRRWENSSGRWKNWSSMFLLVGNGRFMVSQTRGMGRGVTARWWFEMTSIFRTAYRGSALLYNYYIL